MIALYITLGVLAYLMVGCALAQLFWDFLQPTDIKVSLDPETRGLFVLHWPLIMTGCGVCWLASGLGLLCERIHRKRP